MFQWENFGKLKYDNAVFNQDVLISTDGDVYERVTDEPLKVTPEELETMSEEQIMNIIFWPGFSTGETVTDISGRGIGLDIVYTKISQLNGKVKVKSTLGKGCQVSIQLPVTMATIKSFLVSYLP